MLGYFHWISYPTRQKWSKTLILFSAYGPRKITKEFNLAILQWPKTHFENQNKTGNERHISMLSSRDWTCQHRGHCEWLNVYCSSETSFQAPTKLQKNLDIEVDRWYVDTINMIDCWFWLREKVIGHLDAVLIRAA